MSDQATPEDTSVLAFAKLREVNVNEYIEKKNNLSYLSWAWAVDQLLMRDASATWEYRFGIDPATGQAVPYVCIGQTAMVFCTVKAFGVERTAQLPVMDHRNKPIPNPDAFQVNTAMQRCLAKAIALHGLGLYIYAGEDVPDEVKPEKPEPKLSAEELKKAQDAIGDCETVEQLRDLYNGFDPATRAVTKELVSAVKKQLESKVPA
jgi:hypothetical protein